jgi:XTP/dITP diphosphohydrolase
MSTSGADDTRAVPVVVVATGNPHKVTEIAAILEGVAVTLVTLDGDIVLPPEDEDTFEGNALVKARAAARATGRPAIADDSGIEVDALDGAPGVRSARYAGEPTDDAANNLRLVVELAARGATEPAARRARFVSAAALALPDGTEVVVRGTMEGHVADAPRGTGGFGYDPLFVADALGGTRTTAELTPAEKDAISHRGAAFRALRPHLERLVAG